MHKKILVFTFKTLFFTLFFLTIFSLTALGFIFEQDKKLGNKIYPNVYIDGQNFGKKTKEDVTKYFQNKNSELEKIQVILNYKDLETATFSGKTIHLAFDKKTPAVQAMEIGRSPFFLARLYQQIITIFNLGRFSIKSTIAFDNAPVKDYLDYISDKYDEEPENALFKFENGKVAAFKIEKDGLEIKKDETIAQFETDVLKNFDKTAQIMISIKDQIVKAEVTLASVNDFGIVEKIGEGRSNYSGSIPGRIHNLLLASSKLDGILIPKGETFSFNKTVGDISAETGYQPAYVIKNGQTVLGDGGGVCQVSTTLFRTVLNTGLPILERTAHTYRVHYYENDSKPGFDATVFSPSVDFKFQNDTKAAILIQREVDKKNNLLTFIFYGKKDNRQVEISDAKLYDFRPAPEASFQDDPTLKKGITKQVDWAAPGTKAKFHYRVIKDNDIVIDRDFLSNYKAWRAVYLVGTAD